MKSILLILCFAVGGFAVWQHLSHRAASLAADRRATAANSAADRRAEELATELKDAKAQSAKAMQLSDRLKELQQNYNDQRKSFTDSKALLTRNLSAASSKHRRLQDSPPTFDEQRHSWRGNHLRASGVRTSNFDRDRELTKHNEKLDQAAGEVAVIEAELVKADAELDRLEHTYNGAVAQAKAATHY